jgi:hypothetical protein
VESDTVAELLQAAYNERQRLESLLHSDPVFQKLRAVRRIIDLYQHATQPPAPADPILRPDPQRSISRPYASPDQPAKISHPRSDPPSRISRSRWKRGDSQSSRIQAAAADYLRQKGKRATGGEIYKAIAAKGIEVGGRDRTAVVCARLSRAPAIFDHHTPEGYGLREWSDAGAPRKDG